MGLSGDMDKLERLRQMLVEIPLAKGLMPEVAKRIKELALEGFEQETDPYGREWPPRKIHVRQPRTVFGRFDRTRKLLSKTGALRNTLSVRSTPKGIRADYVQYGVYHQSPLPRRVIPRRMFLPEEGELSERWAQEVGEVCTQWFEDTFKRLGK